MLLEHLAEIGGITEPRHPGHLADRIALLPQQLLGAIQADEANIVGRCLIGERLQLVVETGAAHVEHTAKGIHREARRVHIVFHSLLDGGDEFPIQLVVAIGTPRRRQAILALGLIGIEAEECHNFLQAGVQLIVRDAVLIGPHVHLPLLLEVFHQVKQGIRMAQGRTDAAPFFIVQVPLPGQLLQRCLDGSQGKTDAVEGTDQIAHLLIVALALLPDEPIAPSDHQQDQSSQHTNHPHPRIDPRRPSPGQHQRESRQDTGRAKVIQA